MENLNANIVSLSKVSKTYFVNEHMSYGVKEIDFTACPGEFTLILGPSGSGKTTLLTLIAGLLKPTEGKISLFHREIESYTARELQQIRAKRIGFVFQTFLLLEALTASENIELVLKFGKRSHKEAKEHSRELLKEMKIGHLSDKLPQTLSQGEKQRVAIARAIANDAELVLADEPTASLDTANGSNIVELLSSYAKSKHKCVIVVSHDLRLKRYADRVICLEDGRVVQK